jgi:hypothetical protein
MCFGLMVASSPCVPFICMCMYICGSLCECVFVCMCGLLIDIRIIGWWSIYIINASIWPRHHRCHEGYACSLCKYRARACMHVSVCSLVYFTSIHSYSSVYFRSSHSSHSSSRSRHSYEPHTLHNVGIYACTCVCCVHTCIIVKDEYFDITHTYPWLYSLILYTHITCVYVIFCLLYIIHACCSTRNC